jgi:hypothetical protein
MLFTATTAGQLATAGVQAIAVLQVQQLAYSPHPASSIKHV